MPAETDLHEMGSNSITILPYTRPASRADRSRSFCDIVGAGDRGIARSKK